MAGNDPFLEAARAVPSPDEQDEDGALVRSQAFAASRSPERSAALLSKARAAGMSLELTEAAEAERAAVDWRELTRGLPVTRETLADPERAAAMQDDVGALGAVEKVFGGMSEIAWETKEGWQRGRINQRLADIGYRQSQGTATAEEVAEADRLEAQGAGMPRRPLGLVPRGFRAAAESAPLMVSSFTRSAEMIGAGALYGVTAGAIGGAAATAPAGGVGAAPGAVAGLFGGAGIGARAGMMVEVGKQEAGLAYREFIAMPGLVPASPEPPPAAEPMPLVAEIAIERADLGFGKGYVPAPKSEGVVQLPDLLRQIEQAWDAGIRVLLVSVDSTGGSAAAGRLLFHALRCFSELGGRVVAYVDARALSTASLFILGADYVVMNPQALVGIHSPLLSNPSGDEVEGAYLARMRRQDGAVYQARTLLPPETIAAFLDRHGTLEKPGGVLFPTEWAQAFGFVDFVADRRRARRLARRLARGEEVSSPRHAELARRGVVPEVAALVEQLRAEAVSFLAALRAGR